MKVIITTDEHPPIEIETDNLNFYRRDFIIIDVMKLIFEERNENIYYTGRIILNCKTIKSIETLDNWHRVKIIGELIQ